MYNNWSCTDVTCRKQNKGEHKQIIQYVCLYSCVCSLCTYSARNRHLEVGEKWAAIKAVTYTSDKSAAGARKSWHMKSSSKTFYSYGREIEKFNQFVNSQNFLFDDFFCSDCTKSVFRTKIHFLKIWAFLIDQDSDPGLAWPKIEDDIFAFLDLDSVSDPRNPRNPDPKHFNVWKSEKGHLRKLATGNIPILPLWLYCWRTEALLGNRPL